MDSKALRLLTMFQNLILDKQRNEERKFGKSVPLPFSTTCLMRH